MKIVLATRNRGKIREMREVLKGLGAELVSLEDFPGLEAPPETGSTFEENALLKARSVSRGTGLPCLADDSGLEVDALSGRPGVFSARYAGESASDRENYTKLLGELKGVARERRAARFVCVLAFVEPGGGEYAFEGRLEGCIAEEASGEGGFGYDPVFYVPELGRTVAGLTLEEKNRISHRAKALEKFKEWFRKTSL